MDPTWGIPLAVAALKNRADLVSAGSSFLDFVLGKKYRIAFTGMSGVGKTDLAKHLSGEAFRIDYQPPSTSSNPERFKVADPRRRLALLTIPGQHSPGRFAGIEEAFGSKRPVHGVVHVFANGFETLREPEAREAVSSSGTETIEDLRRDSLQAEIEDFKEICHSIRNASLAHGRPVWLHIAVTKVDLFADELETARRWYTVDGPPARILKELRDSVGSMRLSVDASPVCSSLIDFDWGEDVVKSSLVPEQRNAMVLALLAKLRSNCER